MRSLKASRSNFDMPIRPGGAGQEAPELLVTTNKPSIHLFDPTLGASSGDIIGARNSSSMNKHTMKNN